MPVRYAASSGRGATERESLPPRHPVLRMEPRAPAEEQIPRPAPRSRSYADDTPEHASNARDGGPRGSGRSAIERTARIAAVTWGRIVNASGPRTARRTWVPCPVWKPAPKLTQSDTSPASSWSVPGRNRRSGAAPWRRARVQGTRPSIGPRRPSLCRPIPRARGRSVLMRSCVGVSPAISRATRRGPTAAATRPSHQAGAVRIGMYRAGDVASEVHPRDRSHHALRPVVRQLRGERAPGVGDVAGNTDE